MKLVVNDALKTTPHHKKYKKVETTHQSNILHHSFPVNQDLKADAVFLNDNVAQIGLLTLGLGDNHRLFFD